MTDQERMARANAAKAAWELIGPMFESMTAEYRDRIVKLATTELNPTDRCSKMTSLSTALAVVGNIENTVKAMILDGYLARGDQLKAEKMEKMTAPQRRLLGVVPY